MIAIIELNKRRKNDAILAQEVSIWFCIYFVFVIVYVLYSILFFD